MTKWWKHRLDKYYFKTRWHLIADVVLITILLTLILIFLSLYFYKQSTIYISPVKHVEKQSAQPEKNSLIIESNLDSINIASDKEFILKLKVTNNSKTDINNLELSLVLSSNKFSISKIKNSETESNFKISGHKIELANLSASTSHELSLILVIKSLPDAPRLIIWRLNGSYQQNEISKEVNIVLADLKLLTSLTIKAAAYYNSPLGDQLGSGPVPPQVGIPTNYWVFFSPQNIGNNLSNLMVSAKIPNNVTFTDRKSLSAGNFSYSAGQRRITWTVPEIDSKNSTYQVGFELQIIPDSSQINSEPLLMSNLVYSAKDLYCGEEVSGQIQPITTALPFDPINKGQGVVTN